MLGKTSSEEGILNHVQKPIPPDVAKLTATPYQSLELSTMLALVNYHIVPLGFVYAWKD